MKKGIALGTTLFLCVFNLSAWGMDPEEDDVTKITRLLQEVEKRVDKNYDKGTLFLGNTSAGKSALFNYLQGATLHGRFIGFGKHEVIFAPGIDATRYSPIGSKNTVSQTPFPVVIDNNFDCPGFKDTRSLRPGSKESCPFQDIVNASSICRILKHTKNIKILLANSIEELFGTKATFFMDLLDQIGEIFQHNMDALCDGLCLVVTKTKSDQVNIAEYKDLFSKMIEEQLEAGLAEENPRIKILKFLSQTDRIAFFKMPEREGLIPNDDKETINEMLADIPYQANLKPEISISVKSKHSLNMLLSNMLEKMRATIFKLSASYPKLYKRFVKSHPDKKAAQLREDLREVTQRLQGVSDKPEKFYESAKNISGILKLLFHEDQESSEELPHENQERSEELFHEDQESFEGSITRLSFFAEAGFEKEINGLIKNFDIFSRLGDLTRAAERYVAQPEIKYKGNFAIIEGGLLGVSDISEENLKNLEHSTITEIVLKSSGILIDEDLDLGVKPGPTPLELAQEENSPIRRRILQGLKMVFTFSRSHSGLIQGKKENEYVLSIKDHMFIPNRFLFDSKAPLVAKVVAAITLPIRFPIAAVVSPIAKRLSSKNVPIERKIEPHKDVPIERKIEPHKERDEKPEPQSQDEDSIEVLES